MANVTSVEECAARIKLLLMDCDGVLTDGRIWIIDDSDDQKSFNTRDGLGLELFHRAGLQSGIISGRTSTSVARRARALGMTFVKLGSNNKLEAFEAILNAASVAANEVAYVGDDLNDIPIMLRAGLSVAVADASQEAIAKAHYVTHAKGGRGAIREVVELILKSQGRWADVTGKYFQ